MRPSVTDQEVRDLIDSVPHWYHRIELRPGISTPGIHDSALCLSRLNLPTYCVGPRVLDLGARDGFFSFEMERPGGVKMAAAILAADCAFRAGEAP